MKIKTNSNLTSGILFFIVSVILRVMLPAQIPTLETTEVTAATVPSMLIHGMFFCSILLIVLGIRAKEKKEYIISLARMKEPEVRQMLKPILYMLMLLIYAIILPYVGFVIASLLLVNGVLLYFGARVWYFYAIASANVLIAFYVFRTLLSVSLP